MVGLVAAHGLLAGLIPGSGRLSAKVMLSNQRFLYLVRPFRLNFLLASRRRFPFAVLVRTHVGRFAAA
jgi:hypothetical protein